METRFVSSTAQGASTIETVPGGDGIPNPGVALTGAHWTTWRPRHAALTWSRVDGAAALLLDGHEVPGATTNPALFLGPGLPHYALWSRLGKRLAYVVPDGRALVLKAWTPSDDGLTALTAGAPIFPAWHNEEDVLFVHHGTTLQRFDLERGEQLVISQSAAGFRTPAVAPDGSRVAWAEVRDGAVHLLESPSDRVEPREVRSFSAGVVPFYLAGSRLMALVGSSPESLSFGALVDPDTGAPVIKSVMTALWPAPDGQKFVALHPQFSGDGRYQARLWDRSGRTLAATEAFVPSAQMSTVVNFFDQYHLSHPFWSADSRWFGLCGRFATEGPHPAFHDGIQDYVWLWDTETGQLERRVTPGSLLAFEH